MSLRGEAPVSAAEIFFAFFVELQIAQWRATYAVERCYPEWVDHGGEG